MGVPDASKGEALHTQTFLGNPVGCAMALACTRVIQDEDLPEECGGKPMCDGGKMPCLDTSECMDGEFCQTGCCTPIVPL